MVSESYIEYVSDLEEQIRGLLNKVLKLKEENGRLRKDNYDYWTDADWVEYDKQYVSKESDLDERKKEKV